MQNGRLNKLIQKLDEEKALITTQRGKNIPKLHFAGETDNMVSVGSIQQLCEIGGNGRIIIHEKGHLFPTKAVYVNEMLEFLKKALDKDDAKSVN